MDKVINMESYGVLETKSTTNPIPSATVEKNQQAIADNENIHNVVIEIYFDDSVKVTHVLPIRSLSLISYVANMKLNDMTTTQFIEKYEYQIDMIAKSICILYQDMGMNVMKYNIRERTID